MPSSHSDPQRDTLQTDYSSRPVNDIPRGASFAGRAGYGLFISIPAVICVSGLTRIFGFSFFPDEMGYWAVASLSAGWDWSEVVSLGSWYSYGYGLLLTPVLLMFHDAVMAYRAAIVLNLLMEAGAFLLLADTVKKLRPEIPAHVRVVLAGLASLYPPLIFYTQTTMAEMPVWFLYTLLVWLAVRFLQKTSLQNAVPLALCAGALYAVHMRTLSVVIALGLTLLIRMRGADASYKKNCVVVLILTIALIACSLVIKDYLTGILYRDADAALLQVNDYATQVTRLRTLLTPRGIGLFFLSLAGKLTYLGCASCGLAFVGLWALFKKRREHAAYLLILLASVFQILLTGFALLGSADVQNTRLDLFLNGRYDDYLVPALTLAGCVVLATGTQPVWHMLRAGIVTVILSGVSCAVVAVNATGMHDAHVPLMLGMHYFVPEQSAMTTGRMALSVLIALAGGALFLGVFMLYRKRQDVQVILFLVALMYLLCYLVCARHLYRRQSYSYGDLQAADAAAEWKEMHDGRIVHLFEGGNAYIDNVQMRLREESVHVIRVKDGVFDVDGLQPDDFVMTDFESTLDDVLYEMYAHRRQAGHFYMYYN